MSSITLLHSSFPTRLGIRIARSPRQIAAMARPASPKSDLEAEGSSVEPTSGPSVSSSTRARYLAEVFEGFDAESFDWTAFLGTYKGRALITRLRHIASLVRLPLTPSSPQPPQPLLSLVIAALRLLIHEIKSSTWDSNAYLRATSDLYEALKVQAGGMDIEGERVGEEAGVPDTAWVEGMADNERREASRLDIELRGYMSNLIKESIRLTYLAFADLGFKCGSAQNAMKNYAAAREYSTSPQHHLDLGLGIVETCLAFNQPLTLPGHLSKIEAAIDRIHPPPGTATAQRAGDSASTTAVEMRENRERELKGAATRRAVGVKVRVGKGLVALANKEYERAGRELGEVGEEGGLGEWEGQTISTGDIALISALCVLATGDRDRIRRVLLDRTSFRTSLDDTQTWLLDLVRSYMEAKYQDVAAILRKAQPLIVLNPYLYAHASALTQLIQTRSIVQYVEPFSSIKITTMATAFDLSESQMLAHLETLVGEKRIHGRIDLIDKVLELGAPDARAELFAKALKSGREITSTTQAALFRMRLHEARIVVDPRPKDVKENEKEGFDFAESQVQDLAESLRIPAQ